MRNNVLLEEASTDLLVSFVDRQKGSENVLGFSALLGQKISHDHPSMEQSELSRQERCFAISGFAAPAEENSQAKAHLANCCYLCGRWRIVWGGQRPNQSLEVSERALRLIQ